MGNKMQNGEEKNYKIIVYLTKKEKAQAEEFAVSERLKLSALLRKMLLDAADKKVKENE